MRWLVRAQIVSEFVIVGLLYVCFLVGSVGESDAIGFVCLTFLAIMVCEGFIVVLCLEVLEKIAAQEKKRKEGKR